MLTPASALSGHLRSHSTQAVYRQWTLLGWVLLLLCACGPAEEVPSESSTLQARSQEIAVSNGLAFNGLAFNGLAFNGLAFNGLTLNGLNSTAFHSWFQEEPALRNMLMSYMVQCAVPSGQTRTYTSPSTGITYTWMGNLGLAPDWASGKPSTVQEQQVVSACLAAHGNKYGVRIPMSVLGKNAKAVTIPYTSSELTTFSEREGCFFGNLFNNEGIYAVSDAPPLHVEDSTARGCALSTVENNTSQECLPLVRIRGNCGNFCVQDVSKTFYTSCTYNGVTYQPLTTRIRKEEIYTCGDGTCQITEKCGTGTIAESCMSDCGVCG
ncbi:MAG TPA: hypothetical protein VFZ09_09030 [Archangium sp.]|uniref:hypothetical protein n=1 Tax=Archangium sp. TaxID=1872627 RepID=UPI002E330AD4|nr:hypothetical protein [Archangium sp.]HEX5746376.1 hypothetical protein [Archangium sp.]